MASGRTRVGSRERLLAFLGVCLPVPVLAATGLSVPLPGTVERMATELVPFTSSTTSPGSRISAGGTIVLTLAEQEGARLVVAKPRPQARHAAQPSPAEPVQRSAEQPARQIAVVASAQHRGSARPKPRTTPTRPRSSLPTAAPPADEPEREHGREPKPVREQEPKPAVRPEPAPAAKPKPKPKKPKPKEEKKPTPSPEPEKEAKPKPNPGEDEGSAGETKSENAGKDNSSGEGMPSTSDRRPSP
jgi:hypothetical protein